MLYDLNKGILKNIEWRHKHRYMLCDLVQVLGCLVHGLQCSDLAISEDPEFVVCFFFKILMHLSRSNVLPSSLSTFSLIYQDLDAFLLPQTRPHWLGWPDSPLISDSKHVAAL